MDGQDVWGVAQLFDQPQLMPKGLRYLSREGPPVSARPLPSQVSFSNVSCGVNVGSALNNLDASLLPLAQMDIGQGVSSPRAVAG